MKDLVTYFSECDGAAAPGTVMGMGNPMAPEGTTPGSGDTFDHQRRKKKVKPGKEKQEWPDDKDQDNTNEGLLDADFGADDNDLGLGFDKLLEQFAELLRHPRMSMEEYFGFYDRFKATCKELQDKTKASSMSIMKACRGKELVVATFYDRNSTCGYARMAKSAPYTHGIEFRKFIENPRPTAVQVAWDPNRNRFVNNLDYNVNHPTTMNVQTSTWIVLPGWVWDKLNELMGY